MDTPINKTELKTYYFTFGYGHLGLRSKYLKIRARDYEEARMIVIESRVGNRFAFQYEEAEFLPQIEKYNLTEVLLGEIKDIN